MGQTERNNKVLQFIKNNPGADQETMKEKLELNDDLLGNTLMILVLNGSIDGSDDGKFFIKKVESE